MSNLPLPLRKSSYCMSGKCAILTCYKYTAQHVNNDFFTTVSHYKDTL